MIIVVSDIVGAVLMMLLFFVLLRRKLEGQLNTYLIVPSMLIWVHVIGNGLQETEHGPKWVQDHLHDLGVATFALSHVVTYLIVRGKNPFLSGYDAALPAIVMRFTVGAHAVGTLVCVAYKISQITLFREQTIAEGYSGQLDLGDTSMFLLGFLVVLVNHFAMRKQVLRKRDTYLRRHRQDELGLYVSK